MSANRQERDLAEALERPHVGRHDPKARPLVDAPRPLVELGDVQQDPRRVEAPAREVEPGQKELEAEPLPGEVGAEAEAVVEVRRFGLEVVEADQVARFVPGPVVPLRVEHRLDVAVVEVVRRRIPPGSKLRADLFRGRFDADVHSLPGRDRDAAPRFGLDVSHRLRELPAVAGEILDHA